ncbi:Spermine synthase [Candidatus Magnetomorum sp. HK-1]|nr:Spermine synthase [Candidatus Magnetomorum sp. HK-1]
MQPMRMNLDSLLKRTILFTGVSSIVTQLLTIRECYAQFHGNVFIIAMIFFTWLITGAFGTWLARFSAPKILTKKNIGFLCLILATLPSMQILTIRIFRNIFFITGTEIGFYETFMFVFCSICLYAFMIGFALPYTFFVFKLHNPNIRAANVYIYDNIGDALGGLLFSFLLVHLCSPLMTTTIVNIPLIILGGWFILQPFKIIKGFLFFFVIILFLCPLYWERYSLESFQGVMVNYTESFYGRIQVFQDNDRYILVADGIPQTNERNIVFEETMVHYGLSQLDAVHRVLTVSANDGILSEIQKYHPKIIENIEIDAKKSYLEQKYDFIQPFEELRIINADGRQYIRETAQTYDAIILNVPEPDTFQVNGFFTKTFFQTAIQKLSSKGVLIFSIEGFDSYMSNTLKQQISSLYQTALTAFRQVKIFPGEKIIFVCSNASVKMNIPELLTKKGIETQYIQYYYHGDLSKQRIQYIYDQLNPSAKINEDYMPVLVRMTVENWLSIFDTNLYFFILIITFFCCLCMVMASSIEFVLFSSGMTVMGFEIMLIFLFQMIFGDVYYQVCWIVTFFLIGLIPGAFFSNYWLSLYKKDIKSAKHILFACDLAMIAMTFLFIAGLKIFQSHLNIFSFSIYGFLLSMICGFQFPVALSTQSNESSFITRFFAADILGAAFGIVMVSIIGIPFYGLLWTALGLCLIKCFSSGRLFLG